jgi:hypothetical protein
MGYRYSALRSLAAAALVAVATADAGAQTVAEPRLTFGGGAGIANPFHGDFDFTPATWQASVRAHQGHHLVVEAFLSRWWHRSSSESFDVLVHGPSGPLGRVERIAQETTRTVHVVGANVLGRASSGRLSLYGGGGPGYWLHERRFTQTATGCQPSVPQLCGTDENVFNSSALTVQGVAGVGVAIASRVSAFGEYQAVFPIEDPGIGHGAITAGIRVTLR